PPARHAGYLSARRSQQLVVQRDDRRFPRSCGQDHETWHPVSGPWGGPLTGTSQEDTAVKTNKPYWQRIVALASLVLMLLVVAPTRGVHASTATFIRPISEFVNAQGTPCFPVG